MARAFEQVPAESPLAMPEQDFDTTPPLIARRAASNAEFSNYAIIQALPRIQDMSADDGLFVESFIASFAATTPEAEARLQAFLQKKVGKVGRPDEKK